MSETKFKIGDIVSYMSSNKPVSKEIVGIGIYKGEVKTLHFEKKAKVDEVVYYFGTYDYINETEVYANLSALKDSVFPVEEPIRFAKTRKPL